MVNNLKVDIKKLTIIYIILFGALMLIYCSINMPGPTGEWDDYSLPVASIINEHNFSISDADVAYYKELFPNWAGYIDNYSLSGYTTRKGGQMAWYFPTYSFVCIPFTLLLKFLKLPTVYAFPYTNLFFLMAAVVILFKYLKSSDKIRLLMVLLLTLNPIVFYISWTSAEVFIYAMLVVGLTFWYNKWYKRAAFTVSVAGMLNPTIMSIGMIMIMEYMWGLFKNKPKQEKFISFFRQNLLELIKYGCCYIIGVIPMAYNYYNIGHINLTSSLSGFTHGNESTIARFFSYIFDLNYGILPYYPILLIISFVFFVVSIVKRNIRYIEWIITFIINVVLYSIMVHINCGMSGISRYNSWGVLILIFATVLIGPEAFEKIKIKVASFVAIGIGITLTAGIVFNYGPNLASNTSYVYFTPIAEWALNHFSGLYNPLKSTFNSRTIHVDGGYGIETPVVYYAEDGYIRKILASDNDRDSLLNDYASVTGMNDNFIKQVNELDGMGYISLSESDKIVKVESYNVGEKLFFTRNDSTGLVYAVQGMSGPEDWGTWSEGKKTIFRFKTNSRASVLHCEIAASVFNNLQDITISINNQIVYQNASYLGEGIEFDFDNPGEGECIEITIDMPNAISPVELGQNGDARVLGLGYNAMIVCEGESSK